MSTTFAMKKMLIPGRIECRLTIRKIQSEEIGIMELYKRACEMFTR